MKKTALANLGALPPVFAVLYVVALAIVTLTAGVHAARAADAWTTYSTVQVIVGLLAASATLTFLNRGMFWLLDRLARDGSPLGAVLARFAVILGAVAAGAWVGLHYFDYFAGFGPAMTLPGRVVIGLAFAAGVAGWLIALGFWAARWISDRGHLALPPWRKLAQSETLLVIVALCLGTYVAAQFYTIDDQSRAGIGLLVGLMVTIVVLLGGAWLMTLMEEEPKPQEAAPRRATVHSLAAHLRRAYPSDGELPGSPHIVQVFAAESSTQASASPSPDWIAHAYPLQQIVIKLQGTRHSSQADMLALLDAVRDLIRAGAHEAWDHDDDFGYSFTVDVASNGPSFFTEPAGKGQRTKGGEA